jgi:iron-sulfur cluster assembly accessory protein
MLSATTTPASTAPAPVAIHLTPTAATEIRKFMQAEGLDPATGGVRISVMPGGCSGFKYSLLIEETSSADDLVLEIAGVSVFIDPFSAQYLDGVSVDYVTTMMASGFSFTNPNATGGCGCGSSFST